jgi:hypothetical protein
MSTYSTTLRIELIGAGEQDGTWGDTTNSNLGDLIEAAITNIVDITFADANYTLSANNGLPDEARNAVLNLIGTNTAQRNLVAPAVEKTYIVTNNTGANVAITTGGANVVIQDGATQIVYCDGTDFLPATIPYGAGSTGTGNLVYSVSPTFTGTPLAPTANADTNTTQIATTAFVRDIVPTGIISLWYGSIASIPTGWYLCDGSNGTPDLRNRFIVGAGSTYAVAATGGSANAIVVSHTHTANSAVTDPGHTHVVPLMNTNAPSNGSGNLTGANETPTSFPVTSNSAVTGITVATTIDTTGSSATNANLPPYYALAYIMKA